MLCNLCSAFWKTLCWYYGLGFLLRSCFGILSNDLISSTHAACSRSYAQGSFQASSFDLGVVIYSSLRPAFRKSWRKDNRNLRINYQLVDDCGLLLSMFLLICIRHCQFCCLSHFSRLSISLHCCCSVSIVLAQILVLHTKLFVWTVGETLFLIVYFGGDSFVGYFVLEMLWWTCCIF